MQAKTEVQNVSSVVITGVTQNANGQMEAHASHTHGQFEHYTGEALPLGNCVVEPLYGGTCGSEWGYYEKYLRELNGTRFQHDLKNFSSQDYYLQRTLAFGFTHDPDNIAQVREAMVGVPFHEGVGLIHGLNPDSNRPPIRIVKYKLGLLGNGQMGLKQVFVETNFQEGFNVGEMAVFNPALICDEHTRADSAMNEESIRTTGWPVQCNRDDHLNGHPHEKKGTRGHTQAIGTALDGKMPAALRTMTPVSRVVQKYCGDDPTIPGQYEVMGCIEHAHGWALAREYQPETVVILGDGLNSLNMLIHYQAFAPNSKIILAGKNTDKLASLQKVNPDQITTVTTNGHDYSELNYALHDVSRTGKADIVIPMIGLPQHVVEPWVNDGGNVIWWAAKVSEHANKNGDQNGRYTNRHPYGGAPAAERTADEIFSWAVTHRPEILEPFKHYPGMMYVDMGPQAANVVQEWLNHGARYVDPSTGMSVKPIIRMGSFKKGNNGNENGYV